MPGTSTLYYCSGDRDVTYNGQTYLCGKSLTGGQGGPFLGTDTKFALHQKIGLEVDTMSFDVVPGEAQVLGAPFLQACAAGAFDGAVVSIDRAFMPTYGDVAAGIVNVFTGRVGQINLGRSVATFTINSWLETLNVQFPRNVYQPGCLNRLGDQTCGVLLTLFYQTSCTVVSATAAAITADVTNALAGYFDLGTIVMTSGALNGIGRTVRSCAFGAPGVITLLGPFPSAPAPGDTFFLYPGCDKSLGPNGCPKFANVGRYRGFPFIPAPETAV